MDLFSNTPYPNLLPFDGEVYYYPNFFNRKKTAHLYQELLSKIAWENDKLMMFGKQITTQRKVALYGDKDYAYNYSNSSKKAVLWTPELIQLKKEVEEKCNTIFNACLLNLYHNGKETMGWHADDEPELGKNPLIASISLGADRTFSFKHKKNKQTISIVLEKGSLLLMKGETQIYWLHKLPSTRLVKTPRINLTFRNILS